MPTICQSCAAPLAADARFCAQCGTAVGSGRPTPDYVVLERRLFGIPPAGLLLGVAVIAGMLAVVMLALGHWLLGVALLGVTSLALALAAAGIRSRPEARLAAAWIRGAARVRGWAGFSAEAVRAWFELGRERRRLHRRLNAHAIFRDREIYVLGAAALRRDADAEARARERIAALEESSRVCEAAAAEVVEAARRRLAHERGLAQATESLPPGAGEKIGAELTHSRS